MKRIRLCGTWGESHLAGLIADTLYPIKIAPSTTGVWNCEIVPPTPTHLARDKMI